MTDTDIDTEALTALKRKRTTALSAVTRHRNALVQLMLTDNRVD